jgi:hypothetical protein
MKPDWKDAPEWANWLAMEPNGEWFWYQVRPQITRYGWQFGSDDLDCLHAHAGGDDLYFAGSLSTRPKTTTPQPEGQGAEGQGA